jgi:hypothetical protein
MSTFSSPAVDPGNTTTFDSPAPKLGSSLSAGSTIFGNTFAATNTIFGKTFAATNTIFGNTFSQSNHIDTPSTRGRQYWTAK